MLHVTKVVSRILYRYINTYTNLQLQKYLCISTVVSEALTSLPGRTTSTSDVTVILPSFLEPGQELKQLYLPSLLGHLQRNISYNKCYFWIKR